MKHNFYKLIICIICGLYNQTESSNNDYKVEENIRLSVIYNANNKNTAALTDKVNRLLFLNSKYRTGEINFYQNQTLEAFLYSRNYNLEELVSATQNAAASSVNIQNRFINNTNSQIVLRAPMIPHPPKSIYYEMSVPLIPQPPTIEEKVASKMTDCSHSYSSLACAFTCNASNCKAWKSQ